MPAIHDHTVDPTSVQCSPSERVYVTALGRMKGALRDGLNGRLREKTGDARARMRYSDDGYALGIVKRRRLKLLGWPWYLNIPFGNLSHIGGGQTSLAFLIALFNAGLLRFEPATDEEVELAGRNWTAVLPGSPPMRPPPFCWRKMGRNDMGQTRERPVTNPLRLPLRRERKGPKSAKLILDEEISEMEEISSDLESL